MTDLSGQISRKWLLASGKVAAVVLCLGMIDRAAAQEGLPDPAKIVVPDAAVLSDAANRRESVRYFYLTNASVDFAHAYADLVDCYRFLQSGPPLDLAIFVPWKGDAGAPDPRRKAESTGPSPYGVVGAAMAAWLVPMLDAAQNRAMASTRLRACMVPRGYVVHPLAQSVWNDLHRDGDQATIARLAKIATMAPDPAAGGAK